MRALFASFFAILAYSLVVSAANAQSTNATFTGRVLDPTGAAVQGAKVEAVNPLTNVRVSTETNKEGIYTIPSIAPGTYRIEVSRSGFKTMLRPDVVAHVQDVIAINFTLAVGSVSESITVQGGAPLVETESATVSTVIDRQFVDNIPLNGRTLQNLINLTPGIVVTPSGMGDAGQFSVNGQRADSNYFTVDGVSANIGMDLGTAVRQTSGSLPAFSASGTTSNLVSVDAVQEWNIQTSTFAPEFGRTPGAQVSITTRSGTNQFHGTAFDYFRNSVLDASNWFNGFLDLPKGQERQNDFGGVVGGPIYRDKIFFFFSYEGQRLKQPSPQETFVPDITSRSTVPMALQPMLNAFSLPNVPETPGQMVLGIAQFNSTAANKSPLNATSLRLDDNLTKTWQVFARYNYAPSSLSSQSGSNTIINSLRTQTGTVGSTKSFGANIVNETLFNWSRYNTEESGVVTNFGGATVPTTAQLIPPSEGVTLAPGQTTEYGFLVLGVNDFISGLEAKNVQRQINLVDNVSYQAGTHQLKFGVDYRRLTPLTRPANYLQEPVFAGVLGTPLPFPYNLATVGAGTTLEAIIGSSDNVGLIFSNYSFYAQDTWQATPRATLTYGLRYDINPAPTGQNVQLSSFVDPYAMTPTLNPAGTPLYPTKYDDVAPRIGLAYRIHNTPGRETIFRGGFGVFYDLGTNIAGSVATFWPFLRLNTNFFQPFPFSPAFAAPIPFSLNPPYGELTTIDPKIKIPRTYQWNATLEHGLGASQTLTLAYVGASGRDLARNVVLYTTNVPLGNTIEATGGTSNYNALQVQYKRRLYKQFQALASYTWSHSIDTQSVNAGFNNSANPNLDRASSDFDVRHSLSLALTYQPLGGNFGTIGNLLTHHWAVDAIYAAQTAKPVDLSATINLNASAPLAQRPDFVPGVPYFLVGSQYPGGKALNPAAFTYPPAFPAPGSQGDVPRNFFRGFNLSQLDVALHRDFPLHDRLSLQFRAEAFNVLNEPNFGPYDPNISDQLFGQSTSTLNSSLNGGGSGALSSIYQIGGPRSLQLALKLIF
jgi:hypothetical protein